MRRHRRCLPCGCRARCCEHRPPANQPGNARVSGCKLILAARLRRPPLRCRIGMRVKRRHDQMIRQQGRIGKREATPRAGRSPSYHDGRRREVHVDPAALFVSIPRIIDLGVSPRFIQRPDDVRMRQKFRGGGWRGWRSGHVGCKTTAVTGSPPMTGRLDCDRIGDSGTRASSAWMSLERTRTCWGHLRLPAPRVP